MCKTNSSLQIQDKLNEKQKLQRLKVNAFGKERTELTNQINAIGKEIKKLRKNPINSSSSKVVPMMKDSFVNNPLQRKVAGTSRF